MWSKIVRHPAFPYCLPFAICIVLIIMRDLHPKAVYVLYPIQTLAVGGCILWVWNRLPSLKPSHWSVSILMGIAGVIIWIGLDHLLRRYGSEIAASSTVAGSSTLTWIVHHVFPLKPPGDGFNPWIIDSFALSCLLIFFRVAGPTLVVPIMEEIFWRGFLMRYLIQEDFEKIKLGTYSHFSFITVTAMFALIHGEQWFMGVVTGLLYGGWFILTKNLGNVITAHAVTNFLLGLYVLKTGQWWFW